MLAPNSEAPNSAAYQEVTVPLDPETKAVGGALYARHCAACHDGNMVRRRSVTCWKTSRPVPYSRP